MTVPGMSMYSVVNRHSRPGMVVALVRTVSTRQNHVWLQSREVRGTVRGLAAGMVMSGVAVAATAA